MNRILLFLIVCCLGLSNGYAQKNLSDYKYVIVPNRYDMFEEADKFRLNTLTKFLFKKHGFDAIMADEPYSEDLKNDGCLALRANVVEHNGMFKTKLEVELRDCSNALIYKTKIGESRVKEYVKAYNLALRDAFTSFNSVSYAYNGNVSETQTNKPEPKMISVQSEPVKEMKEIKPKEQAKLKKINKVDKEVGVKKTPKKGNIKKAKNLKASNDVLYAQANDNGFQVVDNTPKVVMTLLESGKSDTFIVKGRDAIVYKEDGFWYLSENKGSSTETKRLNIKF